ncbi:hypothetical protein [Acrocarpospora catenulata]|uniref:hypothetical protein n=1 Tax=Acrocarpospora catenulata TaxID=2836182 RepID=UPI001BD92203|nr:hypothetical protein [Acrocarpospora catenulata]
MTTITPSPDPGDPYIADGLAALQDHLTQAARPAPTATPAGTVAVPADDVVSGEPAPVSRRVRRLRAEVAEAHQLAGLQEDDVPLLLDTPKVRKRRRKANEAARLHALSREPAQLAYSAAKARRRINIGLTVALVLALGWSTAGVQVFASDGADAWSPGWVFAWFVEPFMSIALLCFVAARAFFGTRGQPVKDPVLDRVERLFLFLTLGMNAFPYLPGVAEEFSFPRLVLHLLGPIVAYAVVTGWPRLLAQFAALDHGLPTSGPADPLTGPLTGLTYGANTAGPVRATPSPEVARLIERARELIAAGELPQAPSAYRLQRTLRCRMDDARMVRDHLSNPSSPPDPGMSRP